MHFWGNILILLQAGVGAALRLLRGDNQQLHVSLSTAARYQGASTFAAAHHGEYLWACIFYFLSGRSKETDEISSWSWSLQSYWESCIHTNTAELPELLMILNLLAAHWRTIFFNPSKTFLQYKWAPKNEFTHTSHFFWLNIISFWTLAETESLYRQFTKYNYLLSGFLIAILS